MDEKKSKQDAIEEATRNVTDRIAIRFLNAGSSPEFVASNTGLSLEYVQKLSAQNS